KRRMMIIGAFAASVLVSLVALLMPGGSTPPPPDKSKPFTGIVREVLVDGDKIVVEDEQGVPEEISVGKKPRIRLDDGDYILLNQLLPRDRVEIKIDESGDRRKVAIAARRPVQSQGKISQIDPQGAKLTAALAADP